jgi:hypothetical protein
VVSPKIATLKRRKEHATEVMDDPKSSRRDQLQANKLIGAYEGDFVQRNENVNLNVNADLMQMVEIVKRLNLSREQLDTWYEMLGEGEETEALDDGASLA